MAGPFGDLTYNNKVIKPTLRPVEAIASMYDTQSKNYEYAIDNYNKAQTALSNLPVDDLTKPAVLKAQQVLDDELNKIAERGDFENYALNSKQLSYDLANKHGLSAVDAYNKQKSAYSEELKAIEGLTPQREAQYRQDAQRNAKFGYDEELGRWTGSYNGRKAIAEQNWGEKLLDATKGFKADVITDPNTGEAVFTRSLNGSGTGYIHAVTGKAVTEQELLDFSKAYLSNDPQFQAELQEDIYFDMANTLYDEGTGEMRAMTASDLESQFPPRYLEVGRKMFGLGKGNLETELKEKGIKPEQFYSAIKAEEKVERAAIPAVLKESYADYENRFLKMPESTNENGVNTSYTGTIDTYYVEQTSSAKDQKATATAYNNAKNTLAQHEATLAKIENSPTANPASIKVEKDAIAEQKRIIAATADRQAQNLNLLPELKSEVESLVKGQSNIKGVNISMGPMLDLIYRKIGGENIPEEELDRYIDDNLLKEDLEQIRSTEVRSARQQNLPITDAIGGMRRRAKNLLNNKIEEFATQLTDKAEEGQIDYTRSYTAWNQPDMSAAEKRTDPIAQLHYDIRNRTKNGSSSYYRKFVHQGGLDLPTYIEQTYELDLKDGDKILWEEIEARPGIDVAPDSKGNSRPVIPMQIPIIKNGERTVVDAAPFMDEPSYEDLYYEAVNYDRDILLKKQREGTLKPSEKNTLNKYNVALFESGKYGKTYPTTKLLNARDGDKIEVEFMDNALPITVEVSTSGSASGYTYFILGDEKVDESGNTEQTYWARDREGNEVEVTKEQLKPNERGTYEYTPIGANTPYDLKVVLGEVTANIPKQEETFYDVNTVDLASIFKTDIKEGVIPRIAQEVAPYARSIKTTFPGLIVTDALRTIDSETGAEKSLHKVGKALDFRLNEESRKLLSLSDREKQLLKIKEVGLHNGNHIHLEFL